MKTDDLVALLFQKLTEFFNGGRLSGVGADVKDFRDVSVFPRSQLDPVSGFGIDRRKRGSPVRDRYSIVACPGRFFLMVSGPSRARRLFHVFRNSGNLEIGFEQQFKCLASHDVRVSLGGHDNHPLVRHGRDTRLFQEFVLAQVRSLRKEIQSSDDHEGDNRDATPY